MIPKTTCYGGTVAIILDDHADQLNELCVWARCVPPLLLITGNAALSLVCPFYADMMSVCVLKVQLLVNCQSWHVPLIGSTHYFDQAAQALSSPATDWLVNWPAAPPLCSLAALMMMTIMMMPRPVTFIILKIYFSELLFPLFNQQKNKYLNISNSRTVSL